MREFSQAWCPKEVAFMSDIDGTVTFGCDTKGKRKVRATLPRGEWVRRPSIYFCVESTSGYKGDFVRAGDVLMDGSPNPHATFG